MAPGRGRFAAPERRLGFWLALWARRRRRVRHPRAGASGPARSGRVLQVVYRLVGGSFAACGLIAWRRRPDSRSGLLMAAAGFGFFVSALSASSTPPLAQTACLLLQELWAPFFVALLLTLLTGGRLESRVDWLLVGAFVLALWVLQASGCCSTSRRAICSPSSRTPASPTPSTRASARWPAWPRSRSRSWSPCAGGRRRGRDGARCCRASPGSAALLLFAALLTNDIVTGSRSQTVLWLAIVSLVSVPAAFLVGLLRSRLARGGLADLFRDLNTMRGGGLQAALARTLGDPSLVIAYRLPGVAGLRRRRRAAGAGAAGRSRSRDRAGRERRPRGRDARLRRLARRRSRADRGGPRRGGHRAGERAPAGGGPGSARRGAGLARAHRRGRRRRAPAAGAQPARRRPAAAGRALAAAAAAPEPDPERPRQRRAARVDGERRSSRSRWPSCASWPAGSTRPCSTTASPRPSTRWPRARPCRPPSPTRRPGPLPGPVELAAYFVASEALTNVAKYAEATSATRARVAGGLAPR